MRLAESVIHLYEGLLPAKIDWRDFKYLHDQSYPKAPWTDEAPNGGVSKAQLGDITIYRYNFFNRDRDDTYNSPMAFLILKGTEIIAQSDKIKPSADEWKDLDKTYRKLAKQLNSELEVDNGQKVADPVENEWLDLVPERKEKALAAMAELEAALASKSIYSGELKKITTEIEDAISYAKRPAADDAISKAKIQGEAAKNVKDMIIVAADKKLNAVEKNLADLKNNEAVKYFIKLWLKPAIELMDKLEKAEAFAIKGRKPAPPKNVFVPPPASRHSLQMVDAVYRQFLIDVRDDMIERLSKGIEEDIDDMEKSMAKGEAPKGKGFSDILDYFVQTGSNAYDFKGYVRKDKKEIEKSVKKVAARQTDDILQQFVSKNLQKVTSIVAERGTLKKAYVNKVGAYQGRLEGDVTFIFEDGGQFTVNNQVVWVWGNGDRKAHHRFPTTFHDIVFSNGKKVKSESEEWMNKVWAREHKGVSESLASSVLTMHEEDDEPKELYQVKRRDKHGKPRGATFTLKQADYPRAPKLIFNSQGKQVDIFSPEEDNDFHHKYIRVN